MANQYDTNLKLQAIADAIGDSGSSGLISALEEIADAITSGGGGGGGGSFISESLYKSQSTTTADTITLSKPASDYDELRIIIRENSANNYYYENSLSKTLIEQAVNNPNIIVGAIFYSNYAAYYSFTSSTVLTKISATNNFHIDEIIGIKYGEIQV